LERSCVDDLNERDFATDGYRIVPYLFVKKTGRERHGKKFAANPAGTDDSRVLNLQNEAYFSVLGDGQVRPTIVGGT
jgi:hypothetical protein